MNKNIILVSGFLISAFAVRLVFLGDFPVFPLIDELVMLQYYFNELGKTDFFFFRGSSSVIVYFPYYLAIKLLGANELGLRIVSALFGVATVYVAYKIMKARFGQMAGYFTLIVFSFGHWLIAYSRLALPNITAPFLLTLNLFFLDRLKNGGHYFFIVGLVNSACFYFYTGARIIPIFTILYLAIFFERKYLSNVKYLILGLVLGTVPSILFFINSTNGFFSREKEVLLPQISDFGIWNYISSHYMPRFFEAAKILFFEKDQSAYYFAKPLLDPISASLLGVSVITGLLLIRKNKYLFFLILITVISLLLTATTDSAALSSRLTIIIPPVYLIISMMLWSIWKIKLKHYLDTIKKILLICLITGLTFINFFIYFDPINLVSFNQESSEPFSTIESDLKLKRYEFFTVLKENDNPQNPIIESYNAFLNVIGNRKIESIANNLIEKTLLDENAKNSIVINLTNSDSKIIDLHNNLKYIPDLKFNYYISKLCQDCDNSVIALGIEKGIDIDDN